MKPGQLLWCWLGCGALGVALIIWRHEGYRQDTSAVLEALPEDSRAWAFAGGSGALLALAFMAGPLALLLAIRSLYLQRRARLDQQEELEEEIGVEADAIAGADRARRRFIAETTVRFLTSDHMNIHHIHRGKEFTANEAIDAAERLCLVLEQRGHAPWAMPVQRGELPAFLPPPPPPMHQAPCEGCGGTARPRAWIYGAVPRWVCDACEAYEREHAALVPKTSPRTTLETTPETDDHQGSSK
jgi:hypothetical protein